MRILFVIFLSGFLTFMGYAAHAELSTGQSYYYSERAAGDRDTEPTKFEFTLKGSRFAVTNSGSGVRITDGKKIRFQVPLDKNSFLETVRYFAVADDLTILFTDFDGEGSKSAIVRFDSRTMSPRWVTAVHGFNVGDALVTGRFAYLTTIGFIGKLDLESGKFVWKHKDLYNKNPYAFNSFEQPFLENGMVNFPEQTNVIHKRHNLVGGIIVVDDATGKILEIKSK